MNRHRSFRRSSPVSTPSPAMPLVAFLLVACFGLLFVTGCSRSSDGAEKTQDDTFTAEDLARFRGMDDTSTVAAATSSAVLTESGAAVATPPTSAVQAAVGLSAATGSVANVDPAVRRKYDAMRQGSSGSEGAYRVNNAFANVRAQPSTGAPLVTRLNQGDTVSLVEFTNAAWAKISINGKDGYVSSKYIGKLVTSSSLPAEQKKYEGVYFVNFAFVNVRAGMDAKSEKIGEIPGQSLLKPLSMDKSWAKVTLGDKQGYVSTQYLAPFKPTFLVRQDSYTLPVLHYAVDQEGVLAALSQHAAALKQSGVKLVTFADLFNTVQAQEVRDTRLPDRAAVIAVTGITAQNVRQVSDALTTAGVPATLFLQTDQVGISGISEKMLQTLQANRFDIQSAGHTGDDLRTLTTAQTQLELGQSRALLEQLGHKTVFAVAYPQGGANDRVLQAAADAGYLFGIGSAPDATFTRDQFLRLPSYAITSGMTAGDVTKLVK